MIDFDFLVITRAGGGGGGEGLQSVGAHTWLLDLQPGRNVVLVQSQETMLSLAQCWSYRN